MGFRKRFLLIKPASSTETPMTQYQTATAAPLYGYRFLEISPAHYRLITEPDPNPPHGAQCILLFSTPNYDHITWAVDLVSLNCIRDPLETLVV